MKSMTGHGRGEVSQEGFKIAVEVSSVNRKQSEIFVNLPEKLEPLEAEHTRRVLACANSMEDAARELGIDPATLYRKRKALGL